jgi:hypothetical protein
LYDPIARKVIINHDVQVVKNEAWDGSIKRKIIIVDAIGNDDRKDEVVQTPIISRCVVPFTPGNMTQNSTQTTSVRSADHA